MYVETKPVTGRKEEGRSLEATSVISYNVRSSQRKAWTKNETLKNGDTHMSMENLKEYFRKCNADARLVDKAAGIGQNISGHIELARSLGLEITAEDFEESKRAMNTTELTDEQLEHVAGGGDPFTNAWYIYSGQWDKVD